MKVSSGLWILLYFAVGTTLMVLCFFSYSTTRTTLSISDAILINRMDGLKTTATSRKLKENSYNPSIDRTSDSHNMNVEDYNPIDPVPSSKASIKPGPIEHGTPLNPYIPRRSPPPHPSPPHPKKVAEIP